ncbi:MAG: hypothetical protein K2K03_10100 [Prevotella sp.]|nr:hypothetical protein [Prevotella sp.]
MNHTEPYNASPAQGHSNAYRAMEDMVRLYLELGDGYAARMHVERLVGELAIFPDISEAYRHALVLIMQWEEAERLKAEEQRRQLIEQQLQQQLHSIIAVIRPEQTPDKPDKLVTQVELPALLNTEKAMAIWQRLKDAKLVDDCYQPIGMSRAETAMLASIISMKMGYQLKWEPFETLWSRNNMRSDLSKAKDWKEKMNDWVNKINEVLSDL